MREHSFRRAGLSKAGKLVTSALNRLGVRERVLEQQAIGNWARVVGPQIAASARADRVKEGILFVCCKSSAWASELSLHKERIVKGLNDSVGAAVIKDIRFSARGFRRTADPKEDRLAEPKSLEAIELTRPEIDGARRIAAASRSPELASLIEKAVLTGKRLGKLRGMRDGRVDRTGSEDR